MRKSCALKSVRKSCALKDQVNRAAYTIRQPGILFTRNDGNSVDERAEAVLGRWDLQSDPLDVQESVGIIVIRGERTAVDIV